jgi:hypothetical protein
MSEERFEKIQTAIRERNRFLDEHPELIPFQEEITRRLKGATSMENRFVILSMMIAERMNELQGQLGRLQTLRRKPAPVHSGVSVETN